MAMAKKKKITVEELKAELIAAIATLENMINALENGAITDAETTRLFRDRLNEFDRQVTKAQAPWIRAARHALAGLGAYLEDGSAFGVEAQGYVNRVRDFLWFARYETKKNLESALLPS